MLIPTNFSRCILCLVNPPASKEHIFPKSIGGRFQARILCAPCNNNRCAEIVASIQKDSWYLTALTNLKNELPDLYNRTPFQYANRALDGTVIKSSIKNGVHKVTTQSSIDGALTADEANTPRIIRSILSKEGYPESEIKKWEQECTEMPTNTEIRLPNGHVFKKQPGPPLIPAYEGVSTCELAAALIGYEFLALLLGNTIYDAAFAHIREFIGDYQPKSNINVEHCLSRTYHPRHQIDFVQNGRRVDISVNFLGASAYRITLFNVIGEIKDICFVEDLKRKKSFIAPSHVDARAGRFSDMDTLGSGAACI